MPTRPNAPRFRTRESREANIRLCGGIHAPGSAWRRNRQARNTTPSARSISNASSECTHFRSARTLAENASPGSANRGRWVKSHPSIRMSCGRRVACPTIRPPSEKNSNEQPLNAMSRISESASPWDVRISKPLTHSRKRQLENDTFLMWTLRGLGLP